MKSELQRDSEASQINSAQSTIPDPSSEQQDTAEDSPYYALGKEMARLWKTFHRTHEAPSRAMHTNSEQEIDTDDSEKNAADVGLAFRGFVLACWRVFIYTLFQLLVYVYSTFLKIVRSLFNLLPKAQYYFYRAYKTKKKKWVDDKLKVFDNLSIPDSGTKQALDMLNSKVETYETQLAAANVLPDFLRDRVLSSIWVVSLFGASFFPLIWLKFDLNNLWILFLRDMSLALSPDILLLIVVLAIVSLLFFVIGFIIFVIIILIGFIVSKIWSGLIYIWDVLWIFFGIFIVFNAISQEQWILQLETHALAFLGLSAEVLNYGVVGIVIQVVILLASTIISDGSASLVRIKATRQIVDHHPVAILVDNLISILNENKVWNGDDVIEFEHKQQLIEKLEWAAITIGHLLPRNVRTGDVVTDNWFRKRVLLAATALRDKKKWILLPKKTTANDFVKSIAWTLLCVLRGDWVALAGGEALEEKLEKLVEPEKRLQLLERVSMFLLKGLRKILVAALPIGVFFAVQHFFPNVLQGAFLTTALSIIFFYELTVFASILDPDFSKRATDAQSLASKLFPPGH